MRYRLSASVSAKSSLRPAGMQQRAIEDCAGPNELPTQLALYLSEQDGMPREPQQCGMINLGHAHSAAQLPLKS
jgi:hypothetical protein